MSTVLSAAFEQHRPALLRHCYRLMGSFADAEDLVQESLTRAWEKRDTYAGEAPLLRWLYSIATHACLNALAQKKTRGLPQLTSKPVTEVTFEQSDPAEWISPAPDAQLQARESIGLAFIALLQKLPPKQRAAVLMKDVLGWSAEEIALELGLTASSVNSALHRGRETLSQAPRTADADAPPELLAQLLHAWESHDLDALVALLRDDVTLAMPPFVVWVHGLEAVRRLFVTPRFEAFWSSGIRVLPTRANALGALAFYRPGPDGMPAPHSILVPRWAGGRVLEMTVFLGARNFIGFGLPATVDRTISGPLAVMTGKGATP